MRFIKVDTSEALNTFIQKHSAPLLRRIGKSDGRYKLSMSIKPAARKVDGTIKMYEVNGEIAIRGRKQLRAKTKHSDPERAVLAVVDHLEKQLHRFTELTERSRHTMGHSLKTVREYKWEFTKQN